MNARRLMQNTTSCNAFVVLIAIAGAARAQESPPYAAVRAASPEARVTVEAAGGATQRWLLGRSFTMATFEGGSTVIPRRYIAVPMAFEFGTGETAYGLRASLGRLTCSAEGVLGRVRLGGGVGPSYLVITRTTDDDSIRRLGASFHLHAAFEIVRWGETSSVFVRPRGEVDYFWGGEHAFSGTLSLGVRL